MGIYLQQILLKNLLVFIKEKGDFSLKEEPWYGGFQDRLVGKLKRCVKKTIGRGYLDFYKLQTFTNKIELVLNLRPLGILHDDDLEEPLTPNYLLYGHQLHFNNYDYNSLLEYQKLPKRQNQIIPSTGDIANIYDDKVTRHKWLLGRIYGLFTGKNGAIRGAKLFVEKQQQKKVERPINKLYPVEYFTCRR